MRYIFILLLAAISLASATYAPEQQAVYDGLRLSYQIGEAHEKFVQTGDAAAFNTLVDPWNAWVQKNFGQDANLLMQKLAGPVNLQKPFILANNTTGGGMVHAIDGSGKYGPKYTTNDMNLLPDPRNISQIKNEGGAWLGGV